MSSPRIIIFDDYREIAEFSSMMLEDRGFDTVYCVNKEELISELPVETSLLICDFRLGKDTIDEVLSNMPNQERLKSIPLVIVTGLTPESSKIKDLERFNLQAIVEKPFDIDRLEVLCRKILTSI